MHIYLWQIDPLLQLSIDALNTATPNLAHLMADVYIYRTMHIGRLTPHLKLSLTADQVLANQCVW